MEKIISFCGIKCSSCPAFIATKKNDNEARQKVAIEWSNDNYSFSSEKINCDGCLTENGCLMEFCLECNVRECCLQKKIKNCAFCQTYPCDKLDKIFKMDPNAKINLNEFIK